MANIYVLSAIVVQTCWTNSGASACRYILAPPEI